MDWRRGAASAIQRFDAPVLTVVDADGFPVSLRVKRVELHQEGFQVDVPTGWPVIPQGSACLTFHTHTPNFSTQENKEFVGNIVPGEAGMVFRVQRQLADWSGGRTRLAAVWSTIKRGRRLTSLLRAEAARRGQSVPAVHLPSEQRGNNA